jgi:hypothetical protein
LYGTHINVSEFAGIPKTKELIAALILKASLVVAAVCAKDESVFGVFWITQNSEKVTVTITTKKRDQFVRALKDECRI